LPPDIGILARHLHPHRQADLRHGHRATFTYLPAEPESVDRFPITTTTATTVALVWMLRSGTLAVTTTGLPAGGSSAAIASSMRRD
jgi:hypothetical protein